MDLLTDAQNASDFLGEGSYGCVYYPGIDCKGKKNTKKTVTKVQEINFYSSNEKKIGLHIRKHIKNFKNFYGSIIKACIVSFDIVEKSNLNLKKCNTLFEDYNSHTMDETETTETTSDTLKTHVTNEYYLMYSYYIKNKSLKDYYTSGSNSDSITDSNSTTGSNSDTITGSDTNTNTNTDTNTDTNSFSTNNISFVISVLNNFSYLLTALTLLNKHKIIHNDLHVNNILINLKTNKPVIIDFGLSFLINNCYKLNNTTINFYYLKKFIFDFRVDHYHVNIEKRFLCFFVYNVSDEFYSVIDTNDAVNVLTKNIIDIFINDAYDTIANNEEIRAFFSNDELSEYKKALQQFYYQFYNKTDYPTYTSIIKYLLDFVYAYNDLYSLTIDLLYIYYNSSFFLETSVTNDNENLIIILEFFIQLYKKVLYPNPYMRLKINEVYNIYMFIINYIKTVEINSDDDSKYRADFIIAFTKFLKSKSISIEVVFNKNFAFLNFNLLLNKTMFEFVKLHV